MNITVIYYIIYNGRQIRILIWFNFLKRIYFFSWIMFHIINFEFSKPFFDLTFVMFSDQIMSFGLNNSTLMNTWSYRYYTT